MARALSAELFPRAAADLAAYPRKVHAHLHLRAERYGATAEEEQQAHDIADEILARDPLACGWAIHMGEKAWQCHATEQQRAA